MSASTHTFSYNRTHSVTFLADSMRNVLREVIRENGLSPEKLMDEWEVIGLGVRTWLADGHLEHIRIEFYKPGTTTLTARWDFPISYTSSGVDDDMWLDKAYLLQIIAKAARPSLSDSYRIILKTDPAARDVDGFTKASHFSTGNLNSYGAGTVVATGHLTAGASYWR